MRESSFNVSEVPCLEEDLSSTNIRPEKFKSALILQFLDRVHDVSEYQF